MAIHRLFDPDLAPTIAPGMEYLGSGAEAHHAVRVKHLKCGDGVEILNGRGLRALGEVVAITRKPSGLSVLIRSVEQEEFAGGGLIVASAVPKGAAHVDGMVDQLSQLGVWRWVPMICRYSVVNPRAGKIEKWQRIAIESAKQCGRSFLMEIDPPREFADVLAEMVLKCERVFIADQGGESLRAEMKSVSGLVGLLIGPEGGFSDEELAVAGEAAQVRKISLGRNILRIETAAVAGAALVMQHVE